MKKEMLINVLQPEECRIAILEDGLLEELYVERTSHESYTGNIYKGKIVNLEPAIQAAFVDFSVGRNGFLHISDVEPQYYQRQLDEESEPAPREPRRDRDDRRRPRPDDRDAPPPPARGEERSRDRPDLSERGRRDRSEPRRFGEGLTDDWSPPAPAPLPPSRSEPAARDEPRREEPRREEPRREEPRREEPKRGWADLPPASWSEPGPAPRAPERERDPRAAESDEPRGRLARPVEPFDPDLPPSRTQRSRLPSPPPRVPDPPLEDLGRSRVSDPLDLPGESEPSPAREPRRPRGRGGRASRPPVDPEVLHDPDAERKLPEPAPAPPSFESIDEEFPEPPPKRRGGRAAIRSRGGEREAAPERPRSVPPERSPEPEPEVERLRSLEVERSRIADVERERSRAADVERDRERSRIADPERERLRPAEVERLRPPDVERPRSLEAERPRPAEVERLRTPEVERGRIAEPERGRDRPREGDRGRVAESEAAARERRAHDRAGEPGYVPRRERYRGPDSESGPEHQQGWPDSDLDEGVDEAAGDLDPAIDDPATAAEKAEGRRRRRRRGRRRDRERPDPLASASDLVDENGTEIEGDDLDADLDDEGADAVAPHAGRESAQHHGAEPEAISIDDFDFDEAIDEGDDEAGHDDFAEGRAPAAVDEEIDPELEEEIRKEIAEIAELEREMGLRGPVEARPRRGDDRAEGEPARGGRFTRGRGMAKPPIQEVFRRGDEVLVQVIKESIGTKGPTLSTYISIPGRYLVLMPGLNRVGVSRKIADEGQRRKLREIMNDLNPPKGLGFIVRTAGLERTKRELARDLAYLLRLWKVILRRIKKARTPAPIYQESDMITRTIRDIFTSEIDTIWIDEPAAFERAQEFLRVVMPRFVNRLKLYDEKVPLFHKYGIEDEIAKIQRRHVPLPEGGSIVIDQTEALVAIDVNSGNFRVENDAERTAYEMNLRAAKEIARQLRLRDLGGVIVNDFIDMRDERHRRGVERALRDAIKRDRARTKVLRMSAFGLIEMTRQRIRPSLKRSVYEDCPNCAGAGVAKTVESMSIDVMRLLALASHREDIRKVNVVVAPAVAAYLNNRKRREIARLEGETNMAILIRAEEGAPAEFLQIDCLDGNNGEIRLLPQAAPTHHHRRGH